MASDDDCYDDYYGYDVDGEEDGTEVDEDDLLEEDIPAPDHAAYCWISEIGGTQISEILARSPSNRLAAWFWNSNVMQAITKESLPAAQQQDLSMVMNLLNIKQHQARALLIHYRWKMDRIYDHLDRKGRERMLMEASVVLHENNGRAATSTSTSVACNVCFDEFSPSGLSAMECGHFFCNDCWTEYFKVASSDSSKRQIRCMWAKCSTICDEAVVQQLLGGKYPDAAERLDHHLLQSYVEDNDSVNWCPSVPHCGRAIQVNAGERYCEVECPCGVGFCFNCMAAAHSPCPCAMWKMWEVKCNGESENVNWILTNTKCCPKCYNPIEKNGGCNLVTCRCGQYLCWLCGGATGRDHTYTSITGHSCNRFAAEEKKKVADKAKRQLDRYVHYYDRFKIHGESYNVEQQKLGREIEERAMRLESDNMPAVIRDANWLKDGHRSLLRSREVLSRSYVFAYYMFGDEMGTHRAERKKLPIAQVLFEDHQGQLERCVERLSKVLATDVSALPEEDILHTKQKAMDLARIVQKHCGDVYICIQDELLPLLVDPMNIAMYRVRCPDKAKELPA